MCNNSIPANAHNKVVAGENAKEMTEEILQGFVSEATEQYIDRIVDGVLTARDVCEIFVESCYTDILLDMTWREVLDSNIDCCTDETWEDWFENYPDSVYDYCYQFHRTHRMLNY